MIKAVIIDDEPKAIQGLTWELSNFENELEVVATFTEPEKAIPYLKSSEIDCLFLDIEMPSALPTAFFVSPSINLLTFVQPYAPNPIVGMNFVRTFS